MSWRAESTQNEKRKTERYTSRRSGRNDERSNKRKLNRREKVGGNVIYRENEDAGTGSARNIRYMGQEPIAEV